MFWGLLVFIKETVEKNLDKLPYTIMPENTFKHVLKTAIDQNNHDRIVAMFDGSHKHNLSEANLYDIFKTAIMHQNSSLAQKVIQYQNFNSNYQDEQGNTALIIALLHKQPNVAQEIIAIPNTNINLKKGFIFITRPSIKNCLKYLKTLKYVGLSGVPRLTNNNAFFISSQIF